MFPLFEFNMELLHFLLENGKGVEATATDATIEATSSDASASDGE